VRKLILDALFEIGTPDAMLAIRAYMYDESLNVKITAVEYLGRLGDGDSASDMIDLFGRESEPMLLATVLESLGNMSAGPAIKRIIETLAPGGDIKQAPPLYLPQLLRLVAKVGDREDVTGVLSSVDNTILYAEDFMNAVDEAGRRFSNLTRARPIQERIIAILSDREVPGEIRIVAAEKLAALAGEGDAMRGILYELGLELIAQPAMTLAGVRLLAASARPEAAGIIQGVIDRTKDDELRVLFEDIVGGGAMNGTSGLAQ
jgi:HEAT repeat protein